MRGREHRALRLDGGVRRTRACSQWKAGEGRGPARIGGRRAGRSVSAGLRLIDRPGLRAEVLRPPAAVSLRWVDPSRRSTPAQPTLAGGRGARALAAGLGGSLTVSVSSPSSLPGRRDAATPCCRRRRLAPPGARCSLRRWRRPVSVAGLKEEEEEARRAPQPMPQPRAGTRHGARAAAAALAGAPETCMDGHGLESRTFLRRHRR